jgi:hypothetical protein
MFILSVNCGYFGVKGKLDAFLNLTSRGGECLSKSLVLGKLFHP